MFRKILLIACALSLGVAPVAAQDDPPPPMGPMEPHLFIPGPQPPIDPADYADNEAFEEAFFAAVADDDVLTLEELMALMPPPDEMPPPPPDGDEPPPGDMPPPMPGMMIPLPEGFEPPPPEDGHEAFLEAAFAAIAGDDLELTLDEFMAALPDPEEWPPMPPPPPDDPPPPPPDDPPPPPDDPPPPPPDDPPPPPDDPPPPMEGMMPHLFIPLPEGFEPPAEGGPEGFLDAAFDAITDGDGDLTFDELLALMPPPDEPPPPPPEGEEMPPPGLVIPLPEGFEPPADAPPEAFLEAAFGMIAGEDAILTLEELKDWMSKFGPMMGGEPGAGDFGMLPEPPECTDELVTSEMGPQDTNVPCGGQEGNVVFRTVCNEEGYNSQAISLPADRMASCFGIEAITKNKVIIVIYAEADPGGLIYDSTRDGLENIGMVELVADDGDAVYRVELDMEASDPGARVTVRFNDHPLGE